MIEISSLVEKFWSVVLIDREIIKLFWPLLKNT